MSVLSDLICGGSNAVAGLTESAVNSAIAKYGADKKIAFPNTDCYFPAIYALSGEKITTLGELAARLGVMKGFLATQDEPEQALRSGIATVVGWEILEGLKYLEDAGSYGSQSGMGFLSDSLVSTLGLALADGRIPAMALVLGKAETASELVSIVSDYQARGILTFLTGGSIRQCMEGGIILGPESRVIPLGHEATGMVHALTLAIRTALLQGVRPGDVTGLLEYLSANLPAVVNTFGPIDAMGISAGAGAIALGVPVVVDMDLGENQLPGKLESVTDRHLTVQKSLELLGIRPGTPGTTTHPTPWDCPTLEERT